MTDHTETYRVHVVLHVDASTANAAWTEAGDFINDALDTCKDIYGVQDYTVLSVDEPVARDEPRRTGIDLRG